MRLFKSIMLLLMLAPSISSADVVASSSEPVVVGISDLIVELHNTKPNEASCKNRSGLRQAKFYLFYNYQNERRQIANGCWLKSKGKIALFGTKLGTKEPFNYEKELDTFQGESSDWIKNIDNVKTDVVDSSQIISKKSNLEQKIPKPHQIKFDGYIVRYPKGATRETLEQYIPDIECKNYDSKLRCLANYDDFSSIFVRGVNCTASQEIVFILSSNKVTGAACGISKDTALFLEKAFSDRYGDPKISESNEIIMKSKAWEIDRTHYRIDYDNDKFTINVSL